MFNLTNRIQRLFSWIKTNQEHQGSLIVQEQLGTVASQATNDTNLPIENESNITTSFGLSGEANTNNQSNTNNNINNNNRSNIVNAVLMQYQSSSSSRGNNTQENNNNVTNQQPSVARHNRRHRSRRRARSSRSHHHSSNASNNTQSSSSNLGNLYSMKRSERNILSASCAVFCIAILAVSLVEIRWFYLNGGGCNVNYLGVAHFFAPGRLEYKLEMSKVDKKQITVYKFILPNGQVLQNCANREIMLIMRAVIAFVFLAIFSSCIGLMLDTFGCMKSGVKLIRRHGVFHILTVVFCLIINGFCFWISEKMDYQQNETRSKEGKKVEISFDVSYYLIVLASGLSILATAFTLIRRYPSDEDEQLERLLEEYTGFEEPVHLERSLPAMIQPSDNQSNLFILNNLLNNNNNNGLIRHSSQLTQQQVQPPPPPPPATPPPSLHVNNPINSNNNTEPPPPYDPTPAIA